MIARLLVCGLLVPAVAAAQDTTRVSHVTWGGFVDTYYAWDVNRPAAFDRAYTTQAARHAEFNVNLAFIEARLSGPRIRGRLAAQWGTSVQSNYAGEPRIGNISGPKVSQYIQEATVGYQLGKRTWIDGGIFLSHIGAESWISRDNLTYTRSLTAEFSPYYEAGAKLTWSASSKVTTTFVIVNGWQNISAYNTPPAGGLRIDYTPSPTVTVSYDNFVGNAAADSARARLRLYHDLIAQYNPAGRWQFSAVLSEGTQAASTASGGTATWWGAAAFAKYHATGSLGIVGRVETYADPDQVIVITGLPSSFRAVGASVGADVGRAGGVVWRSEIRGFQSPSAVWPAHAGGTVKSNAVLVTSLALTL